MDELIEIFIDNHFTDDFQVEVKRSFSLFEFFEYQQAYDGFIDILNDLSYMDNSAAKDSFVHELQQRLDYVLNEHTLRLIPEASVYQKNEILSALGLLQHLEDYTGIIRTLETLESDEVQLSTILTDYCMLDVTEIMQLIEFFNPRILLVLKDFIYQKESEETLPDSTNKAADNFKLFVKCFNDQNLGSLMVKNGILLNQSFQTYLPFIEEHIVSESNEKTALNFLSLIYLSVDGINAPLLVYRKFSYQLLHDLNLVTQIESLIINYINRFEEFKKVEHEKARLSQTSHTE